MSAIDRLSPSQQLELVAQRSEGLSYRELEAYCLERFGVNISHMTIKNYFDSALETLPKDIKDLKAQAILSLSNQIGKYKQLIDDAEATHNDKAILQANADLNKLLLGIVNIKPDMPMPTKAGTPKSVTATSKSLTVEFASSDQEVAEIVDGSCDDN